MRGTKYLSILLTAFCLALFSACIDNNEPKQEKTLVEGVVDKRNVEDKPFTSFRKSLAALPHEQCVAIYSCLTDTLKADIWKDRMEAATETGINGKKQDVLMELAGLITPEMFKSEHYDSLDQQVQEWLPRAYEAFEGDTGTVVRMLIYLDEPGTTQPTVTKKANDADTMPECDCSIPVDLCKWRLGGNNNVCGGLNCVPTPTGCGWFWLLPCDALCAPPQKAKETKK